MYNSVVILFGGQSAFKKKFTDHFFRVSGSCGSFARWWFQFFFIFIPTLGKISNLTHIFQMGWFNHPPGWGGFCLFWRNHFLTRKIQIRRKSKIGGLLISKEISHARRAIMVGGSDEARICCLPRKRDMTNRKKPTIWRCIPLLNHGDFPAIVMLVNSEDGCSIL